MTEHVSRQAFADFGQYDLVKPLEIRFSKLAVQNDNRSICLRSWVLMIALEKEGPRPERETVESIINTSVASVGLTINNVIMHHLGSVSCYLPGADFSNASKLSVSHVFSPWTLKKAEQPGGGGSLDAIWKVKEQSTLKHVHNITALNIVNDVEANSGRRPGTCWKDCTVTE